MTHAPEPGLNATEAAEIQSQLSDSMWQLTGLPAELRPPDPAPTMMAIDDWATAIVACMLDAGYTNYAVASGGGYTSSGVEGNNDDEQIAQFVCNLRYSVDYGDNGYLNHAQLDYVYDYYKQVLVPCLANHGLEVSDAPTRAEFQELRGGWNPYYSVPEAEHVRVFSDDELQSECTFYPPDFPDPGYFG